MTENRAYYAIIPANVRYDAELTPNAKLLYGEITALCNEKGYCWASNSYFAQLYKVSKVSISKWINQLIKKNYIQSEIINKEGSKEILYRYLRIVNDPIKEKFNTPIKEKFKDNNTLFNNTSNNMSDLDSFFEKLWALYPKKEGKGKIRISKKKELFRIGYEEMERTIIRYKSEKVGVEKQFIQNGSTFFNSGYVDYLDKNYQVKAESKPKKPIQVVVEGYL